MKQIDNVHHAIATAMQDRLDLSHLVVTAWKRADLKRMTAAVVRALGVSNPETELDDVISGAHIGTVASLLLEHSKDNRQLVEAEEVDEATTEFLTLIASATGTESKAFLHQARNEVHAAIALSLTARLDCVPIEERYQATPIDQALSFVVEVADYWHDYKRQNEMVDIADIFGSELEPITECELCLIDRRGVPPLALQALGRLLPRAFFCHV